MHKPEQKLTTPQKLKNFTYEYKWTLVALAVTLVLAVAVFI